MFTVVSKESHWLKFTLEMLKAFMVFFLFFKVKLLPH